MITPVSIRVAVALLVVSKVALAAPAASASSEPEIQLIQRQALASVFEHCITPNTVALTFDDGPYIYEQNVSDTLTRAGIKGTFFVNGNNYDCIYAERQIDSLKHAYSAGHLIGSHTWAHKDLTTLNYDQIDDEMSRVDLALERILGVSPAWMRPPYGSYNNLVRQVSFAHNQSMVIWDFDSGDSTGSTAQQSEQAYADVANKHPSNVLALNHETYETTAHQVLPYAIEKLKAKGYTFKTVAECLGMPAYHSIGAPQEKDSSWTC